MPTTPVDTLTALADLPTAYQISDEESHDLSPDESHDLSTGDGRISDVVSSDNDDLLNSTGLSEGSNWDYYQVRY